MARQLNGAQYSVKFLLKAGVKQVFGIPGHGNVSLFDAVRDEDAMRLVPPKHEQWGGHMADGYFRANRRFPAVVTTSVGPGATNLTTALATAYVDSSTFLAITGDIQTYFFGMGIFQEVERKNWVDYTNGMSHFVKRSWQITSAKQLPRVLPNALKTALCGRPGPVLLDIPMDVQVAPVDGLPPDPALYMPSGRIAPDEGQVREACRILLEAERPLILIGGGIVMSGATEELVAVAEFLGAPVVCSFRGDAKSGFPNDHELWGFHPGNVGSSLANSLTKSADVILALGVTFSDETTSSFVNGVTFSIPPTKLIQLDLDPHEIGKNYPVAKGIVTDLKTGLEAILLGLNSMSTKKEFHKNAWFKRFRRLRTEWDDDMAELRTRSPMGIPNIVKRLRDAVPRDGIVTVSAGLPQEILSQQWLSYLPNTYLSSGGFSTMGFALPAAIGAKLAAPERTVVAVEGDGSFLMNSVELSTAVSEGLPLVVVVLNNYGWISIRDLQIRGFKKRLLGTEFEKPVDIGMLSKSYGAGYARAETPAEFTSAVKRALATDGVTVVEAFVDRRFPKSGTFSYGYWDIPTPYQRKD
ncbi:MAG TPA: thiamine pyrophosphate-binding protein [Nitrososphaerales archaeon]|nr:thiamine pyrophosphate-binding protein [Nitrososphaerales archaeon]